MSQQSDRSQRIRWDLVIGGAALALGLLGYIRPPDPAHPMKFDFLSKSVSLPLWLAGVAVVSIVSITVTVIRLRLRSGDPLIPRFAEPAKNVTVKRESSVHSEPVPTPSIGNDEARLHFHLTSADDLVVSIEHYEDHQVAGLGLTVTNNRLTAIQQVMIRLPLAQSFDGRHNDFRQGDIYRNAQILQQGVIQPACSGNRSLIIRKRKEDDHLMIGDTVGNLMVWPEGDKSISQKWRVPVGVTAQIWPSNGPTGAERLVPIEFVLIVLWNKETNQFSLEKPLE